MEDGIHTARAVSAVLGETQAGKPQVAVQFDVEGGGRITWYGYFSEKTVDRTIESLRFCGWTGNDLTDIKVDGTVSIVVETETYEGKTRQKVQWVNRLGGASVKPLDAGKARAFADQMKGAILAFDQKSGAPVAKKPSGEIPF